MVSCGHLLCYHCWAESKICAEPSCSHLNSVYIVHKPVERGGLSFECSTCMMVLNVTSTSFCCASCPHLRLTQYVEHPRFVPCKTQQTMNVPTLDVSRRDMITSVLPDTTVLVHRYLALRIKSDGILVAVYCTRNMRISINNQPAIPVFRGYVNKLIRAAGDAVHTITCYASPNLPDSQRYSACFVIGSILAGQMPSDMLMYAPYVELTHPAYNPLMTDQVTGAQPTEYRELYELYDALQCGICGRVWSGIDGCAQMMTHCYSVSRVEAVLRTLMVRSTHNRVPFAFTFLSTVVPGQITLPDLPKWTLSVGVTTEPSVAGVVCALKTATDKWIDLYTSPSARQLYATRAATSDECTLLVTSIKSKADWIRVR